jgi:hypothetical protein
MSSKEWKDKKRFEPIHHGSDFISGLLELADRDLKESRVTGRGDDWRFNIAYSSAQNSARAALAAEGYRAIGKAAHFWTLRSLKHTIGAPEDVIDKLDKFRKKRNQATYEHAGLVTETEVDEMIALAEWLLEKVTTWIKQVHPDLLT